MRGAAALKPEDEDDLAIQVAEFLRWALPPQIVWWHTPNGGSRAKVTRVDRQSGKTYQFSPEAKKLKRMGVRPGVYDLAFVMPNAQAAFIELKVGKNDRSDDQVDFGSAVSAVGCGVATCWSLDEVIAVLTRWLSCYGLKLRAAAPGALL